MVSLGDKIGLGNKADVDIFEDTIQNPNDETDSESPVLGDNMVKTETGLKFKEQVMQCLHNQGYEVEEDVILPGKSGVDHIFDLIANRDDGLVNYRMAICITAGGDRMNEVNTIFNFANKAYDTGITDRILMASPSVSPEAKMLAQKQRIKVIDGNEIEDLINAIPETEIPFKSQVDFSSREKLVASMIDMGYQVTENATIRSRSGVEYHFDVLARTDTRCANHSVAIDFLTADSNIGLDPVALYDTKAYESGIDDKVIVVTPQLDEKARLFARHQKIKVVELGEPRTKTPAGKKPAETSEDKAPADKTKSKQLRQLIQDDALQLVPEVMARRYSAIPVSLSGNTLKVAMADPADIFALEAFSVQSKKRIQPITATAQEVRDAIDFNYKGHGEIEKHISHISIPIDALDERMAIDAVVDAPLAQALNLIIEEAVRAHASDIHIEPEEDRVRIRYRIDGTLQDMMSLPINVHRAIISRIKILSDMNIADHHHPQDGQFSTEAKSRDIDVRVATAPTVYGEMAVLRLLDKARATLGLSELGFLSDSLAKFDNMLKVPYGMILVSGPTGAGKTTTLYAAINSLDTLSRNIITIEDPAEYRFKDINQIQVNTQAGITFARGLRSILRLDPDVIMVGEIRDSETTQIAIQSALTGHLMLSSIHASDSSGVLTRLIDLGVESFLISSSVIGIVAQRMVRRVCPDCSHSIEAPLVEQMAYEKEMGEKRTEFIYGTGCSTCAYTGYLGRTGIFEILVMDDAIRALVTKLSGSTEIRSQAIANGMATMMNDGMRKVKEGITTPSEVLRSAYSPDLKLDI